MVLMLLSAVGAVFSFVFSIGPALGASPETQVVEVWRSYGYLVFAGLFVLLAIWPRHYPGVWELAIFHKGALTITALTLISGALDTASIVLFDGLVAVFLIVSYVLTRAYTSWTRLRAT
jgi:hypothetical protein